VIHNMFNSSREKNQSSALVFTLTSVSHHLLSVFFQWSNKVEVTRPDSHAIAQADSRKLPTAVVWVQAQVRSCAICGGQSGTGAGFLQVLQFPLPIRIPPIAPQSLSIICGWYKRPNRGCSTKWTQSNPMRKIKNTRCEVWTEWAGHSQQSLHTTIDFWNT
jgi:hypothetical protein